MQKILNRIICIFLLLIPLLLYADTRNSWLNTIRVQGHTGLSYGFLKKKSFSNAAKEFNILGAESYTRHLKLDWRPPLWPSTVPVSDRNNISLLKGNKDYLKNIVSRANKQKLKIVAYYWDGGEGTPRKSQKNKLVHSSFDYKWSPPDNWFCRDKSGSPILATLKGKARGYHLDLSSGYREFILIRLQEMITRGISGFYFDERHFPKAELGGCFGSETQKKYEALIGYKINIKELSEIENTKYLRFQSIQMVDTFLYWKRQINKTFPKKDIPFIISGTYLSAYILPHMSLTLAEAADSVKVEFSHGIRRSINGDVFKGIQEKVKPPKDIRLAMGWVIPRDASSGRPPHIWKLNHRNIRSIKQFISTIIGYGGIAALHTPEQYLGGKRKPRSLRQKQSNFDTEYEVIKEGFQYGNRLSKIFSNTTSFTFSAIYLSEKYRNNFFSKKDVWNAVMKPVTATYHCLIREGLPVGFIVDKQLTVKNLMNYRVLYFIEGSITTEKLQSLKTKLPNLLFIPIVKSIDKKYNEIVKEITSSIPRVDHLSLFQTKSQENDKVHSVFYKGKNNTVYISLLSGFESLVERKEKITKKIKGLKVILRSKPRYVSTALNHTALPVKKINQYEYIVNIPEFQDAYFLEIGL